jgi:hypothetical protein
MLNRTLATPALILSAVAVALGSAGAANAAVKVPVTQFEMQFQYGGRHG